MSTFVWRREGGDHVVVVGSQQNIEHKVTVDNAVTFTAQSALITIYNSSGATLVSAAAVSIDNTNTAAEHTLSYKWDTGGKTAGDYTYAMQVNAAEQVLLMRSAMTLVPLWSKLDRWVRRIRDLILESPNRDAALDVSEAQYRGLARQAVKEFSQAHPRLQISSVSLTSGTFEYALPTDWTNGFSRLYQVEYPVDDTDQSRDILKPEEYTFDALRSKWRFTSVVPGASETARLYYSTLHTLSDTSDTILSDTEAERYFEATALWAAGAVLLMLANRAAGTNSPAGEGDVVNYRTKQQEYREQGLEWQRLAVQQWGGRISLAAGPLPF